MNLTSFGLCLFACIYSISIYTVVGFGQSCIDDTNCTLESEVCTNGNCTCDTNKNYYISGNQCVLDECASSPCQNEGSCKDEVNGYTCTCAAGYTGATCGTNIDDCNPNPCQNEGSCKDEVNGYTCTCASGYTGATCGTNINDCNPNPCQNEGSCKDEVNGYTCTCASGYTGASCETNINDCNPNPCQNEGSCKDEVNGYTCTCASGYTGASCETNINDCNPNPCQNEGSCKDEVNGYTCTCASGYTGATCGTNIDDCKNSPCLNGGSCEDQVADFLCTCRTGFSSKTCAGAALGASCAVSGTYCTNSNSECGSEQICRCKSSYYDSNGRNNIGGTCLLKKELGETGCSKTLPESCKDGNAECVGNVGTCTCKLGYYDNNGPANSGICLQKKELGETGCSKTLPESCKDGNAECVGNVGTCTCKLGYYDNNGTANSGICLQRKELGTSCSDVQYECADSAAQCLDRKCTCGPNYYDSNGFYTAGGSCYSISDLKVMEISFPADSVTTSGFKVNWKRGTSFSFVNSYVIDWRLKTPDNSLNSGSEEVESTMTSLMISTGVTAGKTYTVTVTSRNNQTQSNVLRTTSSSKEQAAKPNKPGAVNKSISDLHASDGNPGIKLFWARPSGGVSGYKLTLSDGTNILPLDSRIEVVTFNPTWLRNGKRYNVTIQAKSELYGSQNEFVLGELYREEIKTVVTEPTAPRHVDCEEIFDESIVLVWQIPSQPNGDLLKYIVNVYDSQQANVFTNSTSGVPNTLKIGNLKPGTHYTFKVYTQNEKYISTTSGDTTCQTKAKLSDPPHDLRVSVVTSRNFTVQWDKPNNTYSEENYGYVIQTRKGEKCIREIVYNCSNCLGSFQPSALENMCETSVRELLYRTKSLLAGTLSYQFDSLLPDTTYTVSAAAINSKGRGNVAEITLTTNEEAPKKPYSVSVTDIKTTSFLVAWSIDGDRPGKTNFTVYVTADSPAPSKEFTVIGFDKRSKLVDNLEEFWNYDVYVGAATSVGSEKSTPTKQRTLASAPGQVSDFEITDAPGGNYTQMKVTWKAPNILQQNSIIKEYKFEYSSEENSGLLQSFQSVNTDTYTVSVDVRPEQTYTVQVFAVNEQNQNGEKTITSKTTPAGVPINIETTMGVDIIPKQSVKNLGESQFTVLITEEFFTESSYGAVQATGLVACAKRCDNVDIKSLKDFNDMDNWQKARTSTYRVTEAEWRENLKATTTTGARKKRAVTKIEYTVGSDTCSNVEEDEYCNGPLEPDTSYTLFAVSCTNGGCLVSKPYGPFITLAVPEESSLGMIVGIVVAVVVVLAVVSVIGFIMIRKRRRGPGGMKPATGDDDEDFTGIDPALAKIPRKRPIVLNDVEEHVAKMHKDSNLIFSAEYEDLKTLSPKHSCDAADREENRMRNRYINIIPFDHSRVKLSTNGEDDLSDYINANYLPGYTSPREYIACQGAIPGTIDDFWRMVWEQNVSVIVMLTLCKEGQRIKCEQYWPDVVGEPKQYGDVVVEISSYSNIRTYDYRMFKISSGNKSRVVKHFHFLSWLDFQANVHHDIILDFIQHVRQHVQPPDTSGPMIIHCSAGVGRTGTYIVLDHLIQFINEHDFDESIDIFDMVLKLRENRMHMVQTEQQYVFIHDCVKEIMNRKRRETDNIYVNQGFSTDENIYQNENLYANVAKGNSEQNTEL